MPVRMTETYYAPIQKELERYFYELYWKDILALLKKPLYNAKITALIDALRSGRVQYESGVFTGKFNVTISKELSAFAKYDGRAKVWRGFPPSDVIAAATVANDQGRKLSDMITQKIREIPSRVESAVGSLNYSIGLPLEKMSYEAGKDLSSLGISIDMTPELSKRLVEEYTTNMNLNIVNWSDSQVTRLRDMIEKNALSGYNRAELEAMIKSEYGTTMSKAKFLARQETSLFVTSVRDERYSSAGVDIVKWSTSMDIRVTGAPGGPNEPSKGHGNHYLMQGKFCKLSDPTIYADSLEDAKAGKWKSKSLLGAEPEHAGKAFLCRCTYIPTLL